MSSALPSQSSLDDRPRGRVGSGSARSGMAQSDILLRLRSGSPAGDRFRVDSAGRRRGDRRAGNRNHSSERRRIRMMWYPFKAAFRAGGTDDGGAGNYWDDANVGFYSWAGGNLTVAKAFATFAFGDQVEVTGVDAAGFGASNEVWRHSGVLDGCVQLCLRIRLVAMGFTNTTGVCQWRQLRGWKWTGGSRHWVSRYRRLRLLRSDRPSRVCQRPRRGIRHSPTSRPPTRWKRARTTSSAPATQEDTGSTLTRPRLSAHSWYRTRRPFP